MQLKHKGSTISVALTVNETKALSKAAEILNGVALVPCEQKDEAAGAVEKLNAIVKAIGKE